MLGVDASRQVDSCKAVVQMLRGPERGVVEKVSFLKKIRQSRLSLAKT